MVSILIWLLVFLLVISVVIYIIRLLPLPQPWANIAVAIVALIALLILIEELLPLAGHPMLLR